MYPPPWRHFLTSCSKNQPVDPRLSSWSRRLQQMWKIEAPCGLESREWMFPSLPDVSVVEPFYLAPARTVYGRLRLHALTASHRPASGDSWREQCARHLRPLSSEYSFLT